VPQPNSFVLVVVLSEALDNEGEDDDEDERSSRPDKKSPLWYRR